MGKRCHVKLVLDRYMVAIAIVAIGAIVTMVVLTLALLRNGYINKPQLPVPIVPIMLPAEMRVKAFERKAVSLEHEAVALVSDSVAIVCGEGDVPADRYEARNDALRSIARLSTLCAFAASAMNWCGMTLTI